jgi:hypothetical protein
LENPLDLDLFAVRATFSDGRALFYARGESFKWQPFGVRCLLTKANATRALTRRPDWGGEKIVKVERIPVALVLGEAEIISEGT